MEDQDMETMELEEIENEDAETSEGSLAGPLFAGIAGGLLSYAMISGAKKLKAFISERRAARNAWKDIVINVDDEDAEEMEDDD